MSEGTKVVDSPHTLVEGQRLDQPTFHALYEAMPPGTRAELIDGVVYMPSPGVNIRPTRFRTLPKLPGLALLTEK